MNPASPRSPRPNTHGAFALLYSSSPQTEASCYPVLYSWNHYTITGFSLSPSFILSPSLHLQPNTQTTLQGHVPIVLSVFTFLSLCPQINLFHWPLSSQVKQRGRWYKRCILFVPGLLLSVFVLYSFTKVVFILHFSLSLPNYLFFRIWRSHGWYNILLKSRILKDWYQNMTWWKLRLSIFRFLEIAFKRMTKPYVGCGVLNWNFVLILCFSLLWSKSSILFFVFVEWCSWQSASALGFCTDLLCVYASSCHDPAWLCQSLFESL